MPAPMKNLKSLLTIVVLILAVSLQNACSDTQALPKLEGMDGKYHAMSEYIGQGKWVLVNIWSPTCTWCLRELPKIEQFHQQHQAEITTLGVTLDYPSFEYGKMDIVREFLEFNPLNYPVFLADLDLAAALIGKPLVGIPQTTLFHPDGRVVARWAGDIETSDLEQFIAEFGEKYHEDPFVDPFANDE